MKTAEQLKGAIRNIAKDKNVRSQEVLQMFLFERILDRLAASSYKNNFILKGGLLISSMIGISERTTMDMDTTVRGIDMAEVLKNGISMVLLSYKEEENLRVFLPQIKEKLQECGATGDEITPAAVRYDYPLLFEERSIPVMAYTLETIVAEKYETVIRRNIGTTRARDFYDLYALFHVRKEQIRVSILKDAVEHTARKRGSLELLFEWKEIIQDIREEKALQKLWTNYVEENFYASKLTFEEVVDVVSEIGKIINDEERES